MVDSGFSDKTAYREDGLLKIRFAKENFTIAAFANQNRATPCLSSKSASLPARQICTLYECDASIAD